MGAQVASRPGEQKMAESKNVLPDVVHVGFSKCASTFLRSFFLDHPQTHLVSDAHFFVPFERCHFDRGKQYYAGLFRGASPGQLKVESDEHIVLPLLHPVLRAAATTIESVEEAAERVARTVPDAKIILIVRNQTDLMLSRYGEYIMSGRAIDFGDFVDEFLHCSTDGKNYYQNYYSKIADILYGKFSRENVLILLQEELFRDEARVIRQIGDFLRIHAAPGRKQEKPFLARLFSLEPLRVVARSGSQSKNKGLSHTGLRIMKAWNRVLVAEPEEAYYRKARARIPYFLYKLGVRAIRVMDHYLPKGFKGNKRTLVTEQITKKIRSEFADDNRRLGILLSVDLTPFGY